MQKKPATQAPKIGKVATDLLARNRTTNPKSWTNISWSTEWENQNHSKKSVEDTQAIFEEYQKQSDQKAKESRERSDETMDAHILDSYRSFFKDAKSCGQTKANMLGKREAMLRQGFENDQKLINRARPFFDKALNEVYGIDEQPQPQAQQQVIGTTGNRNNPPPKNPQSASQWENHNNPPPPVERNTQSKESMIVSLDLVDVEPYLDIFADQLALSDYDQKMEDISKKWFFKKLFQRTVHRTGRGAYIQSQKEEIKRDVRQQLRDGTLSRNDVIDFVRESDDSILGGNYLDFEKTKELTISDIATKQIIADVINAPDRAIRTAKLKELKSSLERQSNSLLELNQLDASIQRSQNALIRLDLNKTNIGLNIFDIGRIGNERGEDAMKDQVPRSGISRFLNKIDQKIGNAGPIASRISGILRHPTTAAIAATAAVTAGTFSFNTITKALTFWLIPWATLWGVLAAQRSKREELDRQVLVARGQTTLDARKENKLLTEKQRELDALINRHSATAMYLTIMDWSLLLEERQETARWYLAKRESTKTTGINWLTYDGESGSTEQNTRILLAIRSWELGGIDWYKTPHHAQNIEEKITYLNESAQKVYKKREEFARKYGNMEGLKFAAIGYGVGLGIGGVLAWVQWAYHGIMGDMSSLPATTPATSVVTPIHTQSIAPLSHVDRIWMDNNTSAFDGNELRLWKANGGGFEISHMFWHSSSHSNLSDIVRSGDVVGLVTVQGKVYEVALDASGKMLPGAELSNVLNSSSFQSLEIAKHVWGKYEIFASINGDGTGVLTPTVTDPLPTPIPTPIPEPSASWLDKLKYIVMPFGGNKYHETTKWEKGKRIKIPPMPKPIPPSEEPESDHDSTPVPPVEPTPIPPTAPVPPAPPLLESPKDPSSDMVMKEHEKDLRTKLDELFGRRRDFHNRSEKDGPHETRSKDVFQLDEKILWIQDELRALWVKDIPTWNDYIKKNTVGPIPKAGKKDITETSTASDKSPEKDIDTIYGDRISKLITSWDVVRDKAWIPRIGFIDSNRPYIVMKTKNGMAVPFYRSSKGTSGKEKGKWFPFFGLSQADWVIKWNKAQHDNDYFSPEIKRLSKLVNENLDYPHSIDTDDMRKSHPFDSFDSRKSRYNSYGIFDLKRSKPINNKDKNALPYIQEYVDKINGVSSVGIPTWVVPTLASTKGMDDEKLAKDAPSSLETPLEWTMKIKSPKILAFEAQIKENIAKIGIVWWKTAERFNREILGDIAELEGRNIGEYQIDVDGNVVRESLAIKSPQVLAFEAQIKENIAKIGTITSRQTIEKFNREILGDIAQIEKRSVSEYSYDEQGNVIRK